MSQYSQAVLNPQQTIFGTKIGFILACAGSAVGMGNIWLFPYRLGQYGGAAFLIPYLLFIVLFSYAGLSGEFALGRLTATGPIGSFDFVLKEKGKKGGALLGCIPLIGTIGISIGYAVIVGWVLRTGYGTITGAILQTGAEQYFSMSTKPFGSIVWHFTAVLLTVSILLAGITKGIERFNKIVMPSFFLLFFLIAVYVAFLPGAAEGYKVLLIPRWEKLFQMETWIMAMGQAFFSLSISSSGMVIYGSYLSKKENIRHMAAVAGILDTIAALVAGFAIIPAVYAFGMDLASGPPLLFITLPKVFGQMPLGSLWGTFFFAAVFFAGLTSLLTLFEVSIESAVKYLHIKRTEAVLAVGGVIFLCGLFVESETAVGKLMDCITVFIVPLAAVLGVFLIYWILDKKKLAQEIDTGSRKKAGKLYYFVGKYVYAVLAGAVFLLGIAYGGIG